MKISKIWFDEKNLFVQIDSEHIIGNPLSWFERLEKPVRNKDLNLKLDHSGKVFIGKKSVKI